MPFICGMLRSSRMMRRSRGIVPFAQLLERLDAVAGEEERVGDVVLLERARTFITSTSSSSTSRMFSSRSLAERSWIVPWPSGPGEVEGAALPGVGLEPRAAAARLDELANDRQTDAGAFDLVARRERLEDLPDPLVELRRDARAVVGDREVNDVALVVGARPSRVASTRAAVLDRVADEVHEHLLQRHALGEQRRASAARR